MRQICSLWTKQSMTQFQEHILSKENGKWNHTVDREETTWCGKCHDVTCVLSEYWSEHSEFILLSMLSIGKLTSTQSLSCEGRLSHDNRIAAHPSSQATTPIQIQVWLTCGVDQMHLWNERKLVIVLESNAENHLFLLPIRLHH